MQLYMLRGILPPRFIQLRFACICLSANSDQTFIGDLINCLLPWYDLMRCVVLHGCLCKIF